MAEDDLWSGEEWWARDIRVGGSESFVEVQAIGNEDVIRVPVDLLPSAKALKLLVTHLNPLELECFTKFRTVPVVDRQGHFWKLDYDLAPSSSAYAVGVGALCWYPGYDESRQLLPKGDIVLGQKYALETGQFHLWSGRRWDWPVDPKQVLRSHFPELVPYFPQ